VLIEDDRKLDLKNVIGSSPIVERVATIATYLRAGNPVRLEVPDVGGAGGITNGIIQWSSGLEPKPTSAQAECAVIFRSPFRAYTHVETRPISDAGAVLAFFPDNFVQRSQILFVFDYTDLASMGICQWKWTPPSGSDSLPLQRAVRISAGENEYDLPSTEIVFPLKPTDAQGGTLQLKVKGLRGDWRDKETPTIDIALGHGSVAVDWTGLIDFN
jgi:hypothetical protein